jgi:hypothetical protein
MRENRASDVGRRSACSSPAGGSTVTDPAARAASREVFNKIAVESGNTECGKIFEAFGCGNRICNPQRFPQAQSLAIAGKIEVFHKTRP